MRPSPPACDQQINTRGEGIAISATTRRRRFSHPFPFWQTLFFVRFFFLFFSCEPLPRRPTEFAGSVTRSSRFILCKVRTRKRVFVTVDNSQPRSFLWSVACFWLFRPFTFSNYTGRPGTVDARTPSVFCHGAELCAADCVWRVRPRAPRTSPPSRRVYARSDKPPSYQLLQ